MNTDRLRCDDLVLGLGRPEYMPSPEGYLSAIAWQGTVLKPIDGTRSRVALVYDGSPSPGKDRTNLTVRPSFHDALWTQDISWLDKVGLSFEGRREARRDDLLEGVLNSIAGVQAEKSNSKPASPMSENLALLQNPSGMLNKNGPAPYANILESMFRWGSDDSSTETLQSRWQRAVRHRTAHDPLLQRIDSLAERMLQSRLDVARIERNTTETSHREATSEHQFLHGLSSPFQWLHSSWESLTTDEWVSALGPRVWTDWLTAILRLGLGMGYLWECHFYLAVEESILGETCDSLERHLSGETQLLPWVTADATKTQRNVSPAIRSVVSKGNAIREFFQLKDSPIQQFISDYGESPLNQHIDVLRRPEVRDRLREAVRKAPTTRQGSTKILSESIVSSLRERGGDDFYALLRKIDNRNTVIAPGVEWVALLASLTCKHPGRETNLRQFNRSLRQLGLQGPARDVIGLLEVAGLAAGSADADEGVRITSAF